jgi:hypothetical protein
MFIKKAREFTGLWVFDKWKGYLSNSVLLENPSYYQEITIKPFPSRPVMVPPSGSGMDALPAVVSPLDTPAKK